MGLAIGRAESISRHMGIDLRSGQRCMTQEFLHCSQIRSTFEKVSGRGVAQAVRPQIRDSGDVGKPTMHYLANRAWIDAAAACAQEERRARTRDDELWTTQFEPSPKGSIAGKAKRHDAFLTALAKHSGHPPMSVDVVDVETTQLPDADAGGIEQLQDGRVSPPQRTLFRRRMRHEIE